MTGRLADLFRLAWGFVYWNTRKTFYRIRLKSGRGRCPCQHPSDSGRAFETGCAAMLHWNNPGRFRRLCPLLKQTAPGGPWRCSVDRADVRPFWGRAFAFYGTVIVGAYLIATLTVFTFMRTVGYEVTYPGVLWPPAWKKVSAIRSELFIKKYQTSLEAGDMQAAVMALSTAYNLNPFNYAAGLQLARLWQVPQPGYSDNLYRQLLQTDGADAEVIAQSWFRALLTRGDFAGVETLASSRIIARPDTSAAWLNAFLFANRRTGNETARTSLESSATLPANARFLFTLADDLQVSVTPATARARLVRAVNEAHDGLSLMEVCRQLTTRGFGSDVLAKLEQRPRTLGTRDLIALRLDALASLKRTDTLRNDIDTLFGTSPGPVLVELLSAHLIRYPDPALFDRVAANVERTPPPLVTDNYQAYLSLFCAAAVNRNELRLHWVSAQIKTIIGGKFEALDFIGQNLIAPARKARIENYLPALQPLSLEMCYALLEHYYSPKS